MIFCGGHFRVLVSHSVLHLSCVICKYSTLMIQNIYCTSGFELRFEILCIVVDDHLMRLGTAYIQADNLQGGNNTLHMPHCRILSLVQNFKSHFIGKLLWRAYPLIRADPAKTSA